MSLFVSVSNKVLNIGASPTRLLNGLVDQFGDTVLDDVMEFVGNGKVSDRLKDVNSSELNEIKSFFETFKDNEYVNMLLKTVADIPEQGFSWSWSDDLSRTLPISGSVTLTLGASASAQAKILPQPSYFFQGKVGISGNIQIPFSFGAFGVSGGAKGSAALQATFNHPKTTRVLTALANNLPIVADLTNPQQLLNETFTSACLKLRGDVNLGARLTAGRSWVASLGSPDRNQRGAPSTATAEVTAGLQYGIDWARTGEFEVGLQSNGQLLTVTLTEMHKESQRRSLSIGANVKFSGIRETLQPVMDRIAGLPAPLEEIAKKYSRPGDIFKQLLGDKLSSADTHLQELTKVITGDESATSLIDQLVEQAVDTLDAKADGWTAFAKGEVTSLTSSILGRLSIPQTARAELEAVLNKKLLETSDALSEELKTHIESALEKKAGAPITDFLNSISGQTTSVLNAANTTATELLKPVEAFLAQYRNFEQSLVDAVEVVDKEQLALQFIRTVDRSKERSTLLEFTLNPSNDRAVALYQQMLVGNFRDAMIDGLDKQKSYITLVSGQFKTVFERKATTGININVFGIPLSYQRILTGKLTVQNSVGGDIDVFDATGSASAVSDALGEKEETIISSALSLVGAKNDPNAQGLSLRLRYTDTNLSVQEMRGFITSFSHVGLLAEGAADRVSDGSTTIGIPDDDGNRALKFNAQMSLTRAEVEKMGGLDKDQIMTTAIREQLDALDETPVNRDYLVGILRPGAELDPTDHDFFLGGPSGIVRELERMGSRLRPTMMNISVQLIQRIGFNAQGLVDFLKLWQELVAMPLPVPDPDQQLKSSDLSTFNEKNTDMIASLENWAGVAGAVRRALGEEYVSPWSLAFFKTLRALSDREKELLPIYVSWNQDGRVRRIAVI